MLSSVLTGVSFGLFQRTLWGRWASVTRAQPMKSVKFAHTCAKLTAKARRANAKCTLCTFTCSALSSRRLLVLILVSRSLFVTAFALKTLGFHGRDANTEIVRICCEQRKVLRRQSRCKWQTHSQMTDVCADWRTRTQCGNDVLWCISVLCYF